VADFRSWLAWSQLLLSAVALTVGAGGAHVVPTNKSFNSIPNAATTAEASHPAWQNNNTRSPASFNDTDKLGRSSLWAGHRATQELVPIKDALLSFPTISSMFLMLILIIPSGIQFVHLCLFMRFNTLDFAA
jgi:hypothetical protein